MTYKSITQTLLSWFLYLYLQNDIKITRLLASNGLRFISWLYCSPAVWSWAKSLKLLKPARFLIYNLGWNHPHGGVMGIKEYDRYKAFSPVPGLEKKLCKQWGNVYHTVWDWLVFCSCFSASVVFWAFSPQWLNTHFSNLSLIHVFPAPVSGQEKILLPWIYLLRMSLQRWEAPQKALPDLKLKIFLTPFTDGREERLSTANSEAFPASGIVQWVGLERWEGTV